MSCENRYLLQSQKSKLTTQCCATKILSQWQCCQHSCGLLQRIKWLRGNQLKLAYVEISGVCIQNFQWHFMSLPDQEWSLVSLQHQSFMQKYITATMMTVYAFPAENVTIPTLHRHKSIEVIQLSVSQGIWHLQCWCHVLMNKKCRMAEPPKMLLALLTHWPLAHLLLGHGTEVRHNCTVQK